MYLDHNITMRIARILGKIDMSALLLDASGNVVLPEGDQRHFTLPEAVRTNPTTPLVYGGVTLIGTDDEQPVYLCLQGDSNDVKNCAMLCAELINMVAKTDVGQVNREQSLRMMLRGDVEGAELESMAAEHEIPLSRSRSVLYFYFTDIESDAAMQMLQNSADDDDMLCEVGRNAIAMVKNVEESVDFTEMEEYAAAIENTFLTETGSTVFIGVSDPRGELSQISEAFAEARAAIDVGRIYHSNRHVFLYRNLLLERFLNDVPADIGVGYNTQIFNRKTARLFNDEMVHTIETFFENSLNLSETARKLYIHRNTLVYRLEKVQRTIGVDLRTFDDAVTFKMMMLLGKSNAARRNNRM